MLSLLAGSFKMPFSVLMPTSCFVPCDRWRSEGKNVTDYCTCMYMCRFMISSMGHSLSLFTYAFGITIIHQFVLWDFIGTAKTVTVTSQCHLWFRIVACTFNITKLF